MAVRTSVTVTEFARNILAQSRIAGNNLIIPTRLSESEYKKINRIIETMGGKWSRREQAHVFADDPTEVIAAAVATGRTPNTVKKVLEANFATPDQLAMRIVAGEHSEIAALEPGELVLEPSAGDGALVRAILHTNPTVRVTAVEPEPERAATLGHDPRVTVEATTFERFAATAIQQFSCVVMNPPFALPRRPTVWMDHLYAAWNLLVDGGQLLAVVPSGVTYRADRDFRNVREFIASYGGYEELPSDAFSASGTKIRTVLVHLRRPADLQRT
ncbi:class I SAM-dependent methyltransferase [Nocardia puris]|uniref:class I SAM-dependent methyltransferase n=1 Tax=Nocardia puris TaxID=208602 RepID=UPI001895725C|nr:class I SAM-dependent methyltransferase [Nocardia puris]MBF6213150.1 class I SAM-dependent methyltransferase [Nocardia puris]MBF6370078.1 class I SAM-dependent methyltransferase [Nocardia puris]